MSSKKTALIIGSNSEIAKGLMPLLKADGYRIRRWCRSKGRSRSPGFRAYKNGWTWDLCIIAVGSVAPVGYWWEQDSDEWEQGIRSNLLIPIRALRHFWPKRSPGASVCFLAGSNPNMIMEGYSAYNVGKMGLLKAVEQLDVESQDCKLFALGPGTILTKIHQPTIQAQWANKKLIAAQLSEKSGDKERAIRKVYDCLQWAISQPKEVIGGRNICVSDEWDEESGPLAKWLASSDGFKLRRLEYIEVIAS